MSTQRGSRAEPMSLSEALVSTRILPGQTVYLRGDVYSGNFTSSVAGTQAQPITFAAYQNETPIIDGGLTINGTDTIWQGITFRYSGWTTRISAQSGSTPTDVPTWTGLQVFGARTQIKRCTLHDVANIGFWTSAIDGLWEECLIYNIGWDAPDRGHGHDFYTQNNTGTKTIRNNVLLPNYSGYAMHCYAENGYVKGFDMDGNIAVNGTFFCGGYTPLDRLTIRNSILFGGEFILGIGQNDPQGTGVVQDNTFLNNVNEHIYGVWQSYTETGTSTTFGDRILTRGRFIAVLNESNQVSVVAPQTGRYTNCQNPAESITLAAGEPLPMTVWTAAAPIAGAGALATFDPRFAVFLITPETPPSFAPSAYRLDQASATGSIDGNIVIAAGTIYD